jgi:two-component system LytT family response regulator
MSVIKVIIVDDEPLAREGLSLRLKVRNEIEVLAMCKSAEEAMLSIEFNMPDVIFLDIEMPGITGLELAQQLVHDQSRSMNKMPKIVFVTAYREFALNAFDFQAFDYLLKPFSDARLDDCINKLQRAFSHDTAARQYQKLDDLLHRKTGSSVNGLMCNLEVSSQAPLSELQQTISLKSGSEWLRIKINSILWIEAAGDYMCVHTQDGNHIIRKTLKQFEQELDSKHFPRVNRSAIVNMSKLIKLTPNSNGEYIAQLSTGDLIKVSRKYKFQLDELRP